MFVILDFFGFYIYGYKILFLYIMSFFVHLKKQGESNYKSNHCYYFHVYFHLPVRILHICWGVQMKNKMVVFCGFVGGVCTFFGAQIGKMFSNYIAMAWFLHFWGTQIKKKMISNYTFMVGYLPFLSALIEKKGSTSVEAWAWYLQNSP